MADNITPVAEAPVAPTPAPTPVAEAPVAPTPESQSTPEIDESLSLDQLNAVLDAAERNEIIAPEPEPTPNGTKPPAAAPTPAPPATPPGEDEGDDGSKPAAKNFRFHTEDPKQREFLRMMKQQPAANPIELARIAGYELPAGSATPAPAAPPAAPPAPRPDPLLAHRQKVADAKAALKDAEANYKPLDELIDALQDAKLDLRDAEQRHRENESNVQEFEQGRQTALTEAFRLSPEAGTKGTAQYEEVEREIAFLERRNDPILDDPNYPVEVLKRVAKRNPTLFPNVEKPAAAPAAPAAPGTPAPPARLANGQVEPGRTTSDAPLTPKAAVEAIDNLSLAQLEELSNQTGTTHRKR